MYVWQGPKHNIFGVNLYYFLKPTLHLSLLQHYSTNLELVYLSFSSLSCCDSAGADFVSQQSISIPSGYRIDSGMGYGALLHQLELISELLL